MAKETVRPESLQEWQSMFRAIYKEHDDRLYETSSLLLRVVEEMSEMAEALRKDDLPELIKNIPEVFCWLMALYDRLNINIEEALWRKYPGICPYCFREEKCLCITEDSKPKYNFQDSRYNCFRRDRKRMPKSLREWQSMFKRIYGNINRLESKKRLWFHFMEEIGEISKALRHGNKEELEAECADALAWLLPFCTKLELDIDELVWKRFPWECDVCHKQKCECEYY